MTTQSHPPTILYRLECPDCEKGPHRSHPECPSISYPEGVRGWWITDRASSRPCPEDDGHGQLSTHERCGTDTLTNLIHWFGPWHYGTALRCGYVTATRLATGAHTYSSGQVIYDHADSILVHTRRD